MHLDALFLDPPSTYSALHTTSEFWLENYTTSDKVKKDLYHVFIITDSITVIGKTLFK